MANVINMLEDAANAVSRVKSIEMMIEDIGGICGGTPYVFRNWNGGHSDPTYKAFQSLCNMRERLETAKAEYAESFDAAVAELRRIPDKQTQELLYLRHFKKLKWHEIAGHFGPGYSADTLKQRHSRFRRGLQSVSAGGERRCLYGA